jgi:hypothetical protein
VAPRLVLLALANGNEARVDAYLHMRAQDRDGRLNPIRPSFVDRRLSSAARGLTYTISARVTRSDGVTRAGTGDDDARAAATRINRFRYSPGARACRRRVSRPSWRTDRRSRGVLLSRRMTSIKWPPMSAASGAAIDRFLSWWLGELKAMLPSRVRQHIERRHRRLVRAHRRPLGEHLAARQRWCA